MAQALMHIGLLALAAFTVLRAWFRGSLFAVWREYAKAWRHSARWWQRELGQLLTCALCLPPHVVFWLAVLCVLPSYWLPAPWEQVVQLPLYVLAAAALIPPSWIDEVQ
jgi:ABC-type molybdate transport system permease subunit